MTLHGSSDSHEASVGHPDVHDARPTSAPPAAEPPTDDTAAGGTTDHKTVTCTCCGRSGKATGPASFRTELFRQQHHARSQHSGAVPAFSSHAAKASAAAAKASAAAATALKQHRRALARRHLGLARRTRPRMSAAEAKLLLSAYTTAIDTTAVAAAGRRGRNEAAVLLAEPHAVGHRSLAGAEMAVFGEARSEVRCEDEEEKKEEDRRG